MSQTARKQRLVAKPQPRAKIGRAERTRAQILDAAFEFLWSRPFREMTVNSLMATTPISRSAFYRHFLDIHDLMETLLEILETEIIEGAAPWFTDDGDPVALLHAGLEATIKVCHRRGPFLKAVSDAAGADERMESAWIGFLERFDDAVCDRIRADQALGLIEPFDAREVATALNIIDAYSAIRAFGQRPRRRPEPVLAADSRVWISTLYGNQWAAGQTSTLVRQQNTNTGR